MKRDLKKALDIVERQAKAQDLSMADIKDRVLWYYGRIINEARDQPIPHHKPPVDPQKSIQQNLVICLECGKSFQIITPQHMAKHGLTHQEYKEKWGIDVNKPLLSRRLSKRRGMKAKSRNRFRRQKRT